MEPIRKENRYTVRDYLSWDDGERWELIDGVPYAMSPAPRVEHQDIVSELVRLFRNFLKGKPCKAFTAPLDVYFGESEDDETVVQPDLLIVCDKGKIHEKGIIGAPDLIVEVASPSSMGRDFVDKAALYEREGVWEYWIVSPEEKSFYQKTLTDGEYVTRKAADGLLTSSKFMDFSLNVDEFFASLDA